MPAPLSRVDAYRAALAKTDGRAFAFDGDLLLTDDERALLRRMETLDFADAFRRHVATEIELMRLDRLDGEVR